MRNLSKSDGLYPTIKRDREARIVKLLHWIKTRQGEFTSMEALLAKFALEENVSIRKLREYIKLLKLAGEIDEGISI